MSRHRVYLVALDGHDVWRVTAPTPLAAAELARRNRPAARSAIVKHRGSRRDPERFLFSSSGRATRAVRCAGCGELLEASQAAGLCQTCRRRSARYREIERLVRRYS